MLTKEQLDEEWRPVVGFEGFYDVSSIGRVRSLSRKRRDGINMIGRILRPGISTPTHYLLVVLSLDGIHKSKHVHRLVMGSFTKKPNSRNVEVNHINGNKLDNAISNLEWVTRSENNLHAYAMGLRIPARGKRANKKAA